MAAVVAGGGCVGWKLVKGSVTGSIFREFIAGLQLPRKSTLIMDNARIHHATHSLTRQGLPTIRETLASTGATGRYLPPYFPDVAPVPLDGSTPHNPFPPEGFTPARDPRRPHPVQLERTRMSDR